MFTTADASNISEEIPDSDTKNLLVRDEKRSRYILACVRAEKRVNPKELGNQLGMKGSTFAFPEELQALLGITPGSVCLFALMNDTAESAEQIQNHPLENTATVVLSAASIERFCLHGRNSITRFEIPTRIPAPSVPH